ncbi:ribonuclease HI family protein [Scytonema sp. UIC 10036]|uniref:reverse transcriptase-like protein n=1 Tax=Scytonema sp. UIC 10036 TaxID=2304196 RepID=UPI0012DA82A5
MQTNNVAEYSGAIAGLKKALELGCKHIKVFGDSQLVIYQLSRRYKCKTPRLQPLYQQGCKLLLQFEEYHLNWIPRHKNSRADAAAGSVLKAKLPPTVEIPDGLPVPKPPQRLKEKILELRSKGNKAGFKEWLNLKSGWDEFSLLKGEPLADRVPESVRTAILGALRPDENQENFVAKIYRWYLRGLPPALALKNAGWMQKCQQMPIKSGKGFGEQVV